MLRRTFLGGMDSTFSVRVTSALTSILPCVTMTTPPSSSPSSRGASSSLPRRTWSLVAAFESSVMALVTTLDSLCSCRLPVASSAEGPCTTRASAGTDLICLPIMVLPKALSANAASIAASVRAPTMQGSWQWAAPATSACTDSSPTKNGASPKTSPGLISWRLPLPWASENRATRPTMSRNARLPVASLPQSGASFSPPNTQRPCDSLRNGMERSSRSICALSRRWKSSWCSGRRAWIIACSCARSSAPTRWGTRRPDFSISRTACRWR
mmetsp:Transcript_96321/g.250985  ORF Transcript_96321/g.250985 Transcript_96321/m.250985 type:complete len:270 (-) Transcript_96321:368-1177(-)